MNNVERLDLDKSLIKGLSESNATYKPIKKEDYENIYWKLKLIDILVSGIAIFAFFSTIVGIVTLIVKLVIFVFDFEIQKNMFIFNFSIYFAFYCFGLAVISALALRLLYVIQNNIFKKNNIIEFGDINDFTEITLLKYNNLKDLSTKDIIVKNKVQEIMNYRDGKILDFDYKQLNIDWLIRLYKAQDKANETNDSISKVKESFLEQQVDQEWLEQAYPLQQITITLQGTKRSDKADILSLLETVSARLKNGDSDGYSHDDDFGYSFQYRHDVEKSAFKEPCGEK